MEEKGRINQYECNECRGRITTINRDTGTTPMFHSCKATEGCGGVMVSLMYEVSQDLRPTHENYTPDELPEDYEVAAHVEKGGLLIRAIYLAPRSR